ncbi:prenyltransferase/squalene oxidase repeat-containing protein [Streptomyces sp. ODS05-4]|uniref:prenyltransferase/squalene oxidase repeat-containing protein n=1 Tax=Streptomyces sp. ODS05-4 TaxID=2944939 RepID=UPI00210C9F0E|nr:prenyltransferase/squalene oxidase repeat-containing protein [Streptomyces sp. ODS05-4]
MSAPLLAPAAPRHDGDAGLLEALRSAETRLAARVASTVGEDGAVRGICASRALESALTLCLLRAEGLFPRRQEQLASFLRRVCATAGSSSFDRALACGALHLDAHADAESALGDFLDEYSHFTAQRKRLMFGLCLAAVGATPFPSLPPEAVRIDPGQAPWVDLILRALRVLLACDQGGGASPEGEAEAARLAELVGAGQREGVWENHVTAHLLALLALSRAGRAREVVREGATRVAAVQNPDGGVPGIARLEPFCTGPAGLALARSQAAPPQLLHRMAGYLVGVQAENGGWGFGGGTEQTDVDTTAYAANFLLRLNHDDFRPALRSAVGYFRGTANPDGGFPTYLRGHSSEPAMTAGAIAALAGSGVTGEPLTGAVRFLLDSQQENGTFECGWTLSEGNAVWRAMWALHASVLSAAGDLRTRRSAAMWKAFGRLVATQNPDGGWGHIPGCESDVTSTAYSVLAFTDAGATATHRPVLEKAASYLLAHFSPEGGYSAPPDQVAPRPVPFDCPVFTNVWALTALAGLRRELAR